MPKQAISTSTVGVTNIQSLPDIVIGDASNLKATFDKTGLDEKTYINTVLIPELNGNDGSKKIGHNSPNLGSDNVADGLEEVRLIAVQAQAGDILPNSITNTELGLDVKVGSLASLTTTEKSSVVGAINEIDGEVSTLSGNVSSLTTSLGTVQTDLNIVRTAKTTTGSAVALAVDTDGTFDLTRNGNILTVIPNATNTGSVTINVDGQGAKTIKKANDSGTLVNLEAGDIKINVPTQLVRDTVSDFFVYAPKGGSNIKSIQNGNATLTLSTTNITISSVNVSNAIVKISVSATGTNTNTNLVSATLTSPTNLELIVNSTGGGLNVQWDVIEFNNVKSKQVGNTGFGSPTGNFNISITNVNFLKSMLFFSYDSPTSSTTIANAMVSGNLTSNTNILFIKKTATIYNVKWQVIEFN